MLHQMFVEQIPVTEKLLRTILVYTLIVVLIRMSGKRGLSGVNTLDIVVILLLSNVVQNAIIGNDVSVTGGAIGAVTLIGVDWLLSRLALHSDLFARVFEGTETEVIRDGRLLNRPARRLGFRGTDLEHAVRLQNGDDLGQVATGVVEPSGQLLMTLRSEEQGATKGDIERLTAHLVRIEAALAARPA
jgi:uncharacterized membrane protein YcaP (DUF421 family)